MTRQKTDHHITTRIHQSRGSSRRFAKRTRRTNLHRTRRQLSTVPGERHQLPPPPRSTGHHRRHLGSPRSAERHPKSYRDLGAHAGPLDLAHAAAQAKRALVDANNTILRREARRRRFYEDIEQTKITAREASLVVKRAQQALAHELHRLRRELLRPPRLRRARRMTHPSDHDPGTTPFSSAASRAWRLHRR